MLRIVRLVVQLGALFLFGKWALVGLVYCPFAVPFVFCRVCPVLDCPGRWMQPMAGWVILGSGLLAGRAFCGWLCPVGLLGDLARGLPKLDLLKTEKRRIVSRWLSFVKFASLGLVLFLIYVMDNPRICFAMRTGFLSWDGFKMALSLSPAAYRVRLIVFAVGIGAMLVVRRFWCRFLCPLGALLGLLGRASAFGPRVDRSRCKNCLLCRRACPTDSMPGESNCVFSLECLRACPFSAISLGFNWGRWLLALRRRASRAAFAGNRARQATNSGRSEERKGR